MGKLEFRTKSQIVYQSLKENIINGKYRPQQRIVISEVSKEFGVSEIPVREAIKNLESDGLIKTTPYVGAIVTSFDMEDIAKIYQVRTALETMAASLAVQNIEENDIRRLKKQINVMEKAIREKKYERLGILNKEFHTSIYSKCGNEYLYKLILDLWDLSYRTPGVFALIPERAHLSLREHEEILKALEERDQDLVARLIRRQKENSLHALENYFKDRGTQDENAIQKNREILWKVRHGRMRTGG
jgi:DNA-binding GntR family transcriptional regulator